MLLCADLRTPRRIHRYRRTRQLLLLVYHLITAESIPDFVARAYHDSRVRQDAQEPSRRDSSCETPRCHCLLYAPGLFCRMSCRSRYAASAVRQPVKGHSSRTVPYSRELIRLQDENHDHCPYGTCTHSILWKPMLDAWQSI